MFEIRMEEALVTPEASHNDKMSMVLNEAVDVMKSHEKIDPLTLPGMQEIVGDETLFNRYLGKLCEGMGGGNPVNVENFKQIAKNSFMLMANESTVTAIAPMSTLLLPMLRRAWPKIGIKNAIPTQVAKVPTFKVTTIKPWIKDGSTKAELPGDYAKMSFSQIRDRFKKTTVKRVHAIKDNGLIKKGDKWYAQDRKNTLTPDPAYVDGKDYLTVDGNEKTLNVTDYTHDQVDGYTINPNIGILGVEITYWDTAEETADNAQAVHRHGTGTTDIDDGAHTVILPLNFNAELYSEATTDEIAGDKGNKMTLTVTGNTFAGSDGTKIYDNPKARFHPETGFIHLNLKLTKEKMGGTGAEDVSATGGFFGVFERGAWKFIGQSLHSAPSAASNNLSVNKIFLDATIETTQNKKATQAGFDIDLRHIEIPTGEHVETPLALEYLQDLQAQHGIDGTLTATTIISDFIVNKVDIEGFEFIEDYYENFKSDMRQVNASTTNNTQDAFIDRTFDVHPPSRYNGNNDDWIRFELKRIVDNLGSTLKNVTFFNEGEFVIVGNPVNMNLLTHANWQYVEGREGDDGVVMNHSLGTLESGTNRYKLFSSQNIEYDSTDAAGDVNALWMFFVPSNPDHKTLKYYPYTFNVLRTSEGFASPNNPNVPAIMMTKRHKFEEFYRMVGKIRIKNNTGTTGTMAGSS